MVYAPSSSCEHCTMVVNIVGQHAARHPPWLEYQIPLWPLPWLTGLYDKTVSDSSPGLKSNTGGASLHRDAHRPVLDTSRIRDCPVALVMRYVRGASELHRGRLIAITMQQRFCYKVWGW